MLGLFLFDAVNFLFFADLFAVLIYSGPIHNAFVEYGIDRDNKVCETYLRIWRGRL